MQFLPLLLLSLLLVFSVKSEPSGDIANNTPKRSVVVLFNVKKDEEQIGRKKRDIITSLEGAPNRVINEAASVAERIKNAIGK
uniref:Uncharacterized protein n=1 Tax=Caenorhabditis japonica TaxID=281687 RepID=A0A8R1E2K3_CAEJA